jgi:Mor family transcriptional regulator
MSVEKKDRNKDIYNKRLEGWSYRKLSRYFNIDVRAVFDIVKRYKKIEGVDN